MGAQGYTRRHKDRLAGVTCRAEARAIGDARQLEQGETVAGRSGVKQCSSAKGGFENSLS